MIPKNIHYISPSVFPSLSANSVHVIFQAEALSNLTSQFTLYACRSVKNKKDIKSLIFRQYGVDANKIKFVTTYSHNSIGINLKIALLATLRLLIDGGGDLIISRNLYASFMIGVLARQHLVYEIHDIEKGFRLLLQKIIMRCPWIRVICISHQLLKSINNVLGFTPFASKVLHDAAPSGIKPIPVGHRRCFLKEILPESEGNWRGVFGYIGHLFPGRGIEIIEQMSLKMTDCFFVVVGGHEKDVAYRRNLNNNKNLIFTGHKPHHIAIDIAKSVDILLMPYQKKVSVGVSGRDTSLWMSPMKMFEYMATGVPIISSDLPVLREVLHNCENSMLVKEDDPNDWIRVANKLLFDPGFSERISNEAYKQYLNYYSWDKRAIAIVSDI